MPGIGFSIRQVGVLRKEWNRTIVVNLAPLTVGIVFAKRIVTVGSRSYMQLFTSRNIMTVQILYIFCYKLVEVRHCKGAIH